jgi:hypothetical protein
MAAISIGKATGKHRKTWGGNFPKQFEWGKPFSSVF